MAIDRVYTASKVAQVLLALSLTLVLLCQITPWVQVSAVVLIGAGSTALWPTFALACGGVLFVGGSVQCVATSVFSAFSTLGWSAALTTTAGALAGACIFAAVATFSATALLSFALCYSGRARRALRTDDCCSCACTDTSCSGCFCDGGGRKGGRACARFAAAALASFSSVLLFAAAGNFGTKLAPVLLVIETLFNGINGTSSGVQITTAGQALAFVAAALALAAAAAEIAGFVFTQKTHDGSEVYRPAQQVALPHYLASTSLATMPPPPPPPPPRQQQAVATQSPLYTLNAAAAPPPSTLRDATLPPGLHPQVEVLRAVDAGAAHTLDLLRLAALMQEVFGAPLPERYLFDLVAGVAPGRKLRRVYVTESYRGAAIVTEEAALPGVAFLDKFAVARSAQGDRLSEALWRAILDGEADSLYWRSRSSNAVNPLFFEQAHGALKEGDWTVFWRGLAPDMVKPAVACAAALKPTFPLRA